MESRSHRSCRSHRAHPLALALLVVAACGTEERQIESALEVVWEDDPSDNLELGALDGQNGWARVPDRGSAEVVTYSGANRVLKIAAAGSGDESVIIMGKPIDPQSSGNHVLELDVRVDNPRLASLAKIEVDTNPRDGEVGKWANKKFQIYFGSSMRITYGAQPVALPIVEGTVAVQ